MHNQKRLASFASIFFYNLGFLHKIPKQRLGAQGDVSGEEVLKHPFFGNIDWKRLYNRELAPPQKPPTDSGKSLAVHKSTSFTILFSYFMKAPRLPTSIKCLPKWR